MGKYLIMIYNTEAGAKCALNASHKSGYIKAEENAKVERFDGKFAIFGYGETK